MVRFPGRRCTIRVRRCGWTVLDPQVTALHELGDELAATLFGHADAVAEFGDGDARRRHRRDDPEVGLPQALPVFRREDLVHLARTSGPSAARRATRFSAQNP